MHCFEILYYICLYDMNEAFLDQLFELIVDSSYLNKYVNSINSTSRFDPKYLEYLFSMVGPKFKLLLFPVIL